MSSFQILDTCFAIYISYLSNDRRSASILLRKIVPDSSTPDCILMLANILGRDWISQSLQNPKGLSKIEKRLMGSVSLPSGSDRESETISPVGGTFIDSLFVELTILVSRLSAVYYSSPSINSAATTFPAHSVPTIYSATLPCFNFSQELWHIYCPLHTVYS